MQSTLKGIKSIEDFDLNEKNVFLRLDLNVPMSAGKITDETRIQASLPTIEYALEKGARLVMASHLGRPKGPEERQKYSLEPVARRLNELLDAEVILVEEPSSEVPKALLTGGKRRQVILLENLRFDADEEKNGQALALKIASYTDIYINDAFGASHRAHASIVGVPAEVKDKGVGFLMKKELEMLDKLLDQPERPYLAILGGSKVSDKIGVIENLIDRVDGFIIGGAMSYTFLAALGQPVGDSLVEKDKLKFTKDLLDRMEARKKFILLPLDHVIVPGFTRVSELKITTTAAIEEGWMGVDIGPQTIRLYCEKIAKAKTVFWNGPMGVFEKPELANGTFKVASAVAECGGFTVVGGGDSASAANAAGVAEQMTHISTGGGASLEYLQGDVLPGVEALREKRKGTS